MNKQKQFATFRIEDLELAKQAKARAAMEGIKLFELVEKALEEYLKTNLKGE